MAKPKTTLDEHGQTRDRRGEWRSGRPVFLEPLLDRPWDWKGLMRWMFGFPGMLYPWFALYMFVIGISYAFFTPEFEVMQTFSWGWIAQIVIRNVVILTLWNGAFHLWFVKYQIQGRKKKYNGNWMSKNNPTFLFSDQSLTMFFGHTAVYCSGARMNVACGCSTQTTCCHLSALRPTRSIFAC